MEEYTSTYESIKSWAEADRPREKLLLKGKAALSDSELIAILLGSGTRTLSAVDLARQILRSYDYDLHTLARQSVKDLQKFKGIGEAKAISIVSALELGRRRKEADLVRKVQITCSSDVYEYLKPDLLDLPHEEFWLVLLKRNNEIIKKAQVSKGGVSGTVVDPKVVFKNALEELASAIIMVHNHPSGNLNPSQADIQLTRKLKEAGKLLEIPILDHIIFTNHGFYSFADESLL
jgi:DNA repair protein RadC